MEIGDKTLGLRPSGKQLGRGVLSFLLTLAIVLLLAKAMHGRFPILARQIIGATVVAAAYLLFSRWIEHWRPPELNASGVIAEFAVGLAVGVELFSTVMATLWTLGIYHPTHWGTFAGLPSGLLFALCAAVLEEIIFRAYLFRLLSLATGTWIALLATSALFGAAHAANHGATFFSSIAIALEAGVLLAAAYAVTGRLWMPIALHFGWNFAESTLFGMSVSGGPQTLSLSGGTLNGPTLLTGGAFGPEASLVSISLCFAVGVLLLWRAVRLNRIERPMWKADVRQNQTAA
ncbi:MAG: CPBP family intramembrane glutamic endopeptidase [Candidatus Sulfotelmatobacter sp.]